MLPLIHIIDDSEKYARSKFGNQKGISSDEFFSRGTFDSSAQSEAKSRLQGFEGATSISSNAYFGRPEDDMPQADEYGNYGDLEGAARDFVRKFGVTAGDDLENLTQVLGEGATRLQGEFRPRFRTCTEFWYVTDVLTLCRGYTKLSEQLGKVFVFEGLYVTIAYHLQRRIQRDTKGGKLIA